MGEPLLVVKIGGSLGTDLAQICRDLAALSAQMPLIVLHGVSVIMDELCAQQGIAVESMTSPSGHSSRHTPPPVRDIFVQAAEMANHQVVAALHAQGLGARGMLGEQIPLQAQRKRAIRAVINGRVRIVRDDYSGRICRVDAQPLHSTLAQGIVPVLPPMAQSSDGLLNVDGDRAAAAVAGACRAETLVILSNVKGLYRDIADTASFIDELRAPDLPQALEWAQGRMKRKVLAAQEAIAADVPYTIIADGRVDAPVSRALDGTGTRFRL